MNNTVTLILQNDTQSQEFIAYSSFESDPDKEHRQLAINIQVVKQELDNLFSTHKYERPYDPDYFNPIEDLIGELWTQDLSGVALQNVVNKVEKYIPRVSISTSDTVFNYKDHRLDMELVFYFTNDFRRTLYSYTRQFDTVT